MRKLIYVLTDGTEVETLHEAQMSGQGYKAETREIKKGKVKPDHYIFADGTETTCFDLAVKIYNETGERFTSVYAED